MLFLFLVFSFFRRISLWFCFIMTETWINGGIWSGALKPYTLLHITRQNGRHSDCVQYRNLCVYLISYSGTRFGLYSQVVCETVSPSWYRLHLRLCFPLGWRSWSGELQPSKVIFHFPSLVKLQLIKVELLLVPKAFFISAADTWR